MTADWKGHKHDRAAKRHRNGKSSTKILADAGIKFDTRNNGWHIVISEPLRVDFYPTTGLWVAGQMRERGVSKLINFLRNKGAA